MERLKNNDVCTPEQKDLIAAKLVDKEMKAAEDQAKQVTATMTAATSLFRPLRIGETRAKVARSCYDTLAARHLIASLGTKLGASLNEAKTEATAAA